MSHACIKHGEHELLMVLEVRGEPVGKPLCLYCYWEFLEENVNPMVPVESE